MRWRAAGFTLVELVAVLLIVGALSVFVAPRLNVTGFSQYSFHQELLAALRHAQKTANASGCHLRVVVDAANDRYDIRFNGDGPGNCTAGELVQPGGSGNLEGQAPNDVAITNGADFVLDSFGAPDARQTIEIDGGRRVIVEANTGYVHAD